MRLRAGVQLSTGVQRAQRTRPIDPLARHSRTGSQHEVTGAARRSGSVAVSLRFAARPHAANICKRALVHEIGHKNDRFGRRGEQQVQDLLLESLLSLGRHADARRPRVRAPRRRRGASRHLRVEQGHPGVRRTMWSSRGLRRAGRGGDAVKVFDEMSERAVLPNHITYNTMIDGHIKGGDLEAGFRLRDQMLRHGLKPNVISYNVLLSGLCRAGRMGETTALLNEMVSRKIVPDGFTYSILFDGLSRVGDSQTMLSLFEESVKVSRLGLTLVVSC